FDDGAGALPELPVQSYSWAAANPGAALPSLHDFTLTLAPGGIEPGLWGHLAAGRHLNSATVNVRKLLGGEEGTYPSYALSTVTISSFTTSEQGGAAPDDAITLHFDKITETYFPQKADGSLDAPVKASYNQATATSDGPGTLQGESTQATPPLVFVENGVA